MTDNTHQTTVEMPMNENTVLTSREKEVLYLLALGLSNKEIATKLKIGYRTVRDHRQNLYNKLPDVQSQEQLTLWAAQHYPEVAALLRQSLDQAPSEKLLHNRELYQNLPNRQRQVLSLLAQGLTNREIAAGLGIGYSTVRSRINGIFDAFHVHTKIQAVMFAAKVDPEIRALLVDPSQESVSRDL